MPTIDQRTPVRSCIGCRRRRPASELVRITRSVDGTDDGDPTYTVDGPSSGRGAWLCRSSDSAAHGCDSETSVEPTCLELAIRRNQFTRAWRSTITSDDIEAIRAALRHDEQPTD